MENERKILVNKIDVINKTVNYTFLNQLGKCDIAIDVEYAVFAKLLSKNSEILQVAIEYGASLLNLIKKELWENCSEYKQLYFIFTFQSNEDKDTFLNGLQKEYSPVAKLDLHFVNSLAIFLLWRNKAGVNNDKYVYDLGECADEHYYSFSQSFCRYLYIVNKQYNFNEGTFCLSYVNGDGEIKNLTAEFDRAKGAFGSTGFPVIPIAVDFYQLAQKNIFEFLHGFHSKKFENNETQLEKLTILVRNFLPKSKNWESLVSEGDNKYIPLGVICAESMYEIIKNLSRFKNKEEPNKIYNILRHANVLTFMMFASVYKGIYNPEGVKGARQTDFVRKQILSDYKTFFDVFESCNTYAMGCLQLMENVLCYTRGGFFSLRALVRSSGKNATRSYAQIKTFYKNAGREDLDFLQICIADLSNSNSKTLLEKFEDNLRNREMSDILIKPTIEDMFWAPDLKRDPEKTHTKSNTTQNITTYYDYRSYLSDNVTISHHYGLQIFVSSVLEVLGHFYVSSGNVNKCINFDSAEKYRDVDNEQFIEYINMSKNPDSEYYCGTQYYVQLPVVELSKMRKSGEHIGEYIPNDLTFEALDKTYDEIGLNLSDFFGVDFKKYYELIGKLNNDADDLSGFVKNKITLINEIIQDLNKEADKKAVEKFKNLSSDVRNKIPVVLSLPHKLFINEPLFMEIVAKVVFGLCTQEGGYRNIVLKTFNRNIDVANFVRLYSRFYDRFGINANIYPSPQILLLFEKIDPSDKENEKGEGDNCRNANIEFALSGRYLGIPLYEYCQFSGGGYSSVDDDILRSALKSIGRRLINDGASIEEKKNNPHCFDEINVDSGSDEIKHWQRDLYAVLTSDLASNKEYGVRINDCVTHMHISGVHLDRFYKVESLFTNAYWAGKFAEELCKRIIKVCGEKKQVVVLYGYERLLEPMFIRTKKLCEQNGLSVKYMIYDAGYHYSAEATSKEYISGYDGAKDFIKNCILFNIMAISVTLNTFNTMQRSLQERGILPDSSKTFYHTVIQIYNENTDTQTFFKEIVNFGNDNGNIPNSKFDGNVQFVLKTMENTKGVKKLYKNLVDCSYLVAVPAKCYKPDDCPLCLLEENSASLQASPLLVQYEKAVFSTDDTSLVPSFMVEPNYPDKTNGYSIADNNNNLFFSEIKNSDGKSLRYLYQDALFHKHLVRNGAHYQNYIRTEMLIEELSKQMNSNDGEKGYSLPFKILKNQFEERRKRNNLGEIENYINVLVAPYHNSNQMFPSLINDMIFNGKAHIISFNATKIFRSNFVAEFDNYSILLDKINKRLQGVKNASEIVRFYYVDDQINSGDTFTRTKSLVSELFEKTGNVLTKFDFTAIFVLIDRHSKSFRRDLIENEDMFFSVFKFLAPNLRSSGDTCPLCKQVAQDKDFLKRASLDSTAGICYRRIQEHKVEEISEANDKWIKETDSALIKANNMRRFHTENLLFEAIKSDYVRSQKKFSVLFDKEFCSKLNDKDLGAVMQLAPLYDAICRKVEVVCREHDFIFDNGDSKLEYLISFSKSLSRPFFSYRPYVATVAIKFLEDIIDSLKIIALNNESNQHIVFNSFVNEKKQKISISMPSVAIQHEKYINLLLVCVSGLAGLNSTYLLNPKNLEDLLLVLKNLLSLHNEYKSIFDESAGIGTNDSLKKMSYADYIRFSVFRVLQTEPYGNSRRKVFRRRILKLLRELFTAFSNDDENHEQLYSENKYLRDKLFFYSLLYLESGYTEENKEKRTERILKLRNKIIEQNDVKGEPKWDSNSANQAESSKSGTEKQLDKLFENCFPYILKKKDSAQWLIPLTVEGYNDAFYVGYDILTGERTHVPTESGCDDGQLCGRLKLIDKAYDALERYGISISDENIRKWNDYVYVKFKFYDYDYKIEDDADKNRDGQSIPDTSLYLRFDRNSLLSLGKECIKTLTTEYSFESNEIVNTKSKSYEDLAMLIALGEAVNHRTAIIKWMHDLLDTNAVDKLVAERESSSALSISKAAKHGNAQMEQIAGIASYENLVKIAKDNISSTKQNVEIKDVLFASVQRLLANRLLTAMYRVESTLFIEESKIDAEKKYFTPDSSALMVLGKKDSRRAAEEIWYRLLKNGFYIFGKADNADHSDNKILKIGFNVHRDDGTISEYSDLGLSPSKLIEGELFDCNVNKPLKDIRIRFKLDNINFEEQKLNNCAIIRILSDAKYSTDDEFSDNINYFVTAIVLFGYNAVRYSGRQENEELELKLKFVKDNDKYFVACESLTESEEAAKESVQKAKKSIAIPPWVRHGRLTSADNRSSENAGITLWTLAQYFNRSWNSFLKNKNARDDVRDAIDIDYEGNKFIIKLRVYFKED